MNLCCQVNARGQCSNCRATFCWDHLEEQYITPITKGRLSCTQCKWFWTIFSYPLRRDPTYRDWPEPQRLRLAEYDYNQHQYWNPSRQSCED